MSPLLTVTWIAFQLCIISLSQSQLRDFILIKRTLDENGLSWSDANEYCQNEFDSNLATIITTEEYQLAYDISYLGGLIGLNDIDDDDQFTWIDGTPCENNDTPYCTDLFIPTNDPVQKCSITAPPPGDQYPTDWNCNDTYKQWYCNKGMISSFSNQANRSKSQIT